MLSGTSQRAQAISGTVTDCTTFVDGDITEQNTLGELLVGGGTILFDCDGTITLPAGVQIEITVITTLDKNSHSITIQGNGSRVFHVNESASLTVIGLTVTGGSGVTSGGGILIEANGTAILQDGTVVTGNSASSGSGITNNGGTLTVTNSVIFDNNGSGTDNVGGGITNNGGTLTITNCTLSNNSASYRGGAIYQREGTLTVSNSRLFDNYARYGSGIYIEMGAASVINTALFNNSAWRGGGIYNLNGTVSVRSSTLSYNATTSMEAAFLTIPAL